MTLEYKAVKMKEKGKVKSDDDFYYVEGYASTFDNIDNNENDFDVCCPCLSCDSNRTYSIQF